MQPRIRKIKTSRKSVSAFKGVCLRETTPDGFFSDEENMSSDSYPAVAPRKRRSVFENCADVGAMYSHGEMVWTWGEYLYYGSERVGSVSEGEKMFASLGAYVVVYPDKKVLNTETLALTDMDHCALLAQATVSPSNADGSAAEETAYAKISAAGIGAGFRAGDGVSISGLEGAGIGGSFIIQTVEDDFIVVISSVSQVTEVEGAIEIARRAPDLDYICGLGNRVWGCCSETREVRACKLGDPWNWNVFQGISTDSYAATVPSAGDFTGCADFVGSAVFFKENEIIKLFGTKPSNFELVSSRMPGVEKGADKSIAYSDSLLFYKGQLGVYAYDGSVPALISDALGWGRYSYGCAGAMNGKYYISMYDGTMEKYRLFVYDTSTRAWHIENGGRMRYFACVGDDLYMASADGNTYAVNGKGLWYDPEKVGYEKYHLREARCSWYALTGPISLSAPDRQYVSRMNIRFLMEEGASFTIALRYRGEDEFRDAAHFSSASGERTFSVPVRAVRADSVYLKLYGSGHCAITGISQTFERGSDS